MRSSGRYKKKRSKRCYAVTLLERVQVKASHNRHRLGRDGICASCIGPALPSLALPVLRPSGYSVSVRETHESRAY